MREIGATGGLITAEQEVQESFPLPESIIGSGDLFTPKIIGESMIDAAICEGDACKMLRKVAEVLRSVL